MILISHRGNLGGRIPERENHPDYIDEAITLGYDVEIDLWFVEGKFMLGHDEPQYEVYTEWLYQRSDKVWIHCKNIKAFEFFNFFHHKQDIHYFWHEEDTVTLTSKGYIWAYPGKQPIKNSIAVMPEIHNEEITHCKGVCSDYIKSINNENTL
jgi:hypothetical protein